MAIFERVFCTHDLNQQDSSLYRPPQSQWTKLIKVIGLKLTQCVFLNFFIMQMVAIHKRSNRESVDGFVSLSPHRAAGRYLHEEKQYMTSCEPERNSTLLLCKLLAALFQEGNGHLCANAY